MRIKLTPIFALVGIMLFSVQAHAESLVDGDPAAGKTKAITCTACHGAQGNSAVATWPNLAGQHASYALEQLKAFKGEPGNPDYQPLRYDPVMSAQAMLLSEEDMADLAVYFESLPGAAQAVADPDLLDLGEALYRGGDLEKGVAACIACHGPSGRGNPASAYPVLAGQHATYTEKQLKDYAAGTRATDGKTQQMRDIASRLDARDIKALASYVQGLR